MAKAGFFSGWTQSALGWSESLTKKRALEGGQIKVAMPHPRRRHDRGLPGEARVTVSTIMVFFNFNSKLLLWTRKKRFPSFIFFASLLAF